jgi:hypothetical protein
MEISKLDSKIAIEARIEVVRQRLAALDKLVGQAEKLEAELLKLKSQETEILKDGERTDEAKLKDLLSVRGSVDLKQAAIAALRGEASPANNAPATHGKIGDAQEQVAKAGEVSAQFFVSGHSKPATKGRN